jgi:lysophospholipid acyltransferase (LPLAT)-like uncharacterized protein
LLKRTLRRPAVQAALARLLGLYLLLALRSTRWTLLGAENFAPHAAGTGAIAAFWHERLPLATMVWLMARDTQPAGRRMHVLVSRHRDGRFIGAVMRPFRLSIIHGSSSRGGPAALRAMLRVLAGGDHIAITPDGPRGPRRVAAPGVAQLAALSGVPVLPCAAQTSKGWVLKTWDRMVIPRPFGRGVVVCLPAIPVPRDGWAAALPVIQEALDRAAATADAACRA